MPPEKWLTARAAVIRSGATRTDRERIWVYKGFIRKFADIPGDTYSAIFSVRAFRSIECEEGRARNDASDVIGGLNTASSA